MPKHHYVYHSYEEWGREYIGVRSCDCMPEEDTKYFGSFKDKTFFPTEKTILFVCETREEAMEIEIELHDFFDVAVNPQFANRSKQTSTKFDTTGVPNTEAQKKANSERMLGVPHTEEAKKKISEANSGENHPLFGVPHTEEWKKAQSERISGEKNPNYGNTGALSARSKAIIAIKPNGTELHFGGVREAARELKTNHGGLSHLLKTGKPQKKGNLQGWQFLFENR